MKKKVSILIFCCMLMPLFALFGCGEKTTYSVSVFSSSTVYGTVKGEGTYESGKKVTLTATAKNGSSFVAWIFQGSTEIRSENGYTISNNITNEKVTTSTLKFDMSSARQGRYTAVFSEEKMTYIKLNSFKLEKADPDAEATVSPASMDLSIMQGTNLETIYDDSVTILEEQTHTPDITTVLRLTPDSTQYVRAHAILTDTNEGNMANLNFACGLNFQTSTPLTAGTSYDYKVDYLAGSYTITFTFTYVNVRYNLVLQYQNLA